MTADAEGGEGLVEFRAVIDVRLAAYDIEDALHRLALHFLASSVLDEDAPSLIHAPSSIKVGRADDPQFAVEPATVTDLWRCDQLVEDGRIARTTLLEGISQMSWLYETLSTAEPGTRFVLTADLDEDGQRLVERVTEAARSRGVELTVKAQTP